jgi:hypothetical protein
MAVQSPATHAAQRKSRKPNSRAVGKAEVSPAEGEARAPAGQQAEMRRRLARGPVAEGSARRADCRRAAQGLQHTCRSARFARRSQRVTRMSTINSGI